MRVVCHDDVGVGDAREVDHSLLVAVFAGLELEAGCDLKVPWISCTE